MMLNGDQIVAMGLISQGFDSGSIRDAGYDLRIENLMVLGSGGDAVQKQQFYLEPQGIAAAISKETVRMPSDVCGYVSVKTDLCRDGVLAINIGIIDPGWEGPISSVLLNFGKRAYCLEEGRRFLRLTFHKIDKSSRFQAQNPANRTAYETGIRRKLEGSIGETFMDLDKAAEKGSKKFANDLRDALLKYLPIAALALTLLTFLLNFGVLTLANRAMPYDVVQLRAEKINQGLNEKVEALRKENDDLKARLAKLEQGRPKR